MQPMMTDWHCPLSVDEQALDALNGNARTPAQRVVLAWHLRQRDTPRALALAAALQRELGDGGHHLADGKVLALLPKPLTARLLARLQLVRAEAAWLGADLGAALAAAEAGRLGFEQHGDLAGQSDAWALRAHLAVESSRFDLALADMQQSQTLAAAAGDTQRSDTALGVLAFWSVMAGADAAETRWEPVASRLRQAADPQLAMWGHDFHGALASRRGQIAQSIRAYSEVVAQARRCGQIRRAIVACLNVCVGYNNLDDHASALDWVHQGLALARPAGWPASIGQCLMMSGNSLCKLQRFEAARPILLEAQALLSGTPGSRNLALVRKYLGGVAMGQGDFAGAVEAFRSHVQFARSRGLRDLESDGQRLLAQALLLQGLRAQAAQAAAAALQLAEAEPAPLRCIDALLVLAQASCPAPAPGQPKDYDPVCLRRAVALAESIAGYALPAVVWDAMARRQAAAGDFAQAYQLAQRANAVRDASDANEAANRTLALEARRETQRLRAEAETLRQRTEAEALRALALQADNDLLEGLGRMGSTITAQLQPASIFEQLQQSLGALLEGQHVSLWMRLPEPDGPHLALVHGIDSAQPLAWHTVPLTDTASPLVKALLGDQEVVAEGWQGAGSHWASAAAGPLRIQGRVAGVLCVCARQPAAYGERERLVLRNVCAWAAVALENAMAVQQLEAARQQLQDASDAELQARQQAEQATQLKGEFLAHISHDLRTPLASVHGYLETLLLRPGDCTDDDRMRYLQAALGQSVKVRRLVHELRDLGAIETGAAPAVLQPVELAALVHEVVQKLELAARARSQRVSTQMPPRLPLALADPGLIERVLTNLVHNAIHHTPEGSRITVEVDVDVDADGRNGLRVAVVDTGPGIPLALRGRLFKRPLPAAQPHRPGGGGLGLLIVQRLLQQLGSEIHLIGRAGAGAAFEFHLNAADG